MLTKSQQNGQNKKRAKNGQFVKNACLNGYAHFKTGDFSTLVFVESPGYTGYVINFRDPSAQSYQELIQLLQSVNDPGSTALKLNSSGDFK